MDFMYWYNQNEKKFHTGSYQDPANGNVYDFLSGENRLINFMARVLDMMNGPGIYTSTEFRESMQILTQESASYDGITIDKVCYDGSYASYATPSVFIRELGTPYLVTVDSATQVQIQYAQDQNYTFWGISDCLIGEILSPRGCPPRASVLE